MQFRRSGQRDERRRRVLIDERTTAVDDPANAPSRPQDGSPSRSRRYAEAALERQPRLAELVPLRNASWAMILLTGLTGVAALAALYGQSRVWCRILDRHDLVAFDLAQRGSVAAWYSALLLALAAFAAVFIYTLRRHKVDDYRGTYRLWLWTAAFLLVGSIEATAPLHRVATGLLAFLAGPVVHGDKAIWWTVACGSALAAFGLRLIFEMSACRGAVAALLMAGLGYAAGSQLAFDRLLPYGTGLAVMLAWSAMAVGHVALAFSFGLYARHVLRDAHGNLPVPRRQHAKQRSKNEQPSQDEENSTATAQSSRRGKRIRVDAAHDGAGDSRKRTDLDSDSEVADSGNDNDSAKSATPRKNNPRNSAVAAEETPRPTSAQDLDSGDEDRQLSKAERRRLRKKMRHQQPV
jgi:hypothetical protein